VTRPRIALDVRLYLVTGPGPRGRDLVDVVEAAVAGGVTLVQLRDKSAGPAGRLRQVVRLRRVLDPWGVPLVVDDDLGAAAGAAGVHLGPFDPAPTRARAVLGPHAVVGWSVEHPAQLVAAGDAFDYAAASPVWTTPSKTDTAPSLGLSGVRAVRRALDPRVPLVGIGGIDEANAGDVVSAGCDGVAVVSAVCAADDPEAAARDLRRAVDSARAARGAREVTP